MKKKIFSILFALVLVVSFCLVTAVPVSAAGTPTIDGTVSAGEWDGAVSIPVAGGMGTVKLLASTDYLYVLFDLVDSTDARLGENLKGNDQISINVNPTDGGSWGFPYDLIFETSADLPWNPKDNSGIIDGWNTRWFPNNAQEPLPVDLESATIYSGGKRITEWKLPLATIAPSLGDTLKVGGAIEVGDGNSYVYPVGLDWSTVSTFAEYSYRVNNQDTGLYYQTIQAAINAATAGDTINVGVGTYDEQIVIDKSLTLVSVEGKDNTIINGRSTGYTGAVVVTSGTSDVTIGDTGKGFTVNGAGQAAIYVVGSNDSITICSNKLVAANTKNALLTGGVQSNHIIADNEFSGTASQLVYVNGEASLGSANASIGVNFTNNTFSGTATGPAFGQEATNSTVSGNTFATVTGYAALELWGGGNTVTDNNFTADLPAKVCTCWTIPAPWA